MSALSSGGGAGGLLLWGVCLRGGGDGHVFHYLPGGVLLRGRYQMAGVLRRHSLPIKF